MMSRILLLLSLVGMLVLRASDAIELKFDGASTSVTQPHVVAELIPEVTTVKAGKPFDVALHLHMDKDWHTYWINPGDAGLATSIKWTLPPGFTAGPIQWPAPEKHDMGGLTIFGYGGDVYLLTTITPPKGDLPQHFDVKAKASWLVCKEECIPGKAELTLPLDGGMMNLRLPVDNKDFFEAARERLPVANTAWNVSTERGKDRFYLKFDRKDGIAPTPKTARFFPEQPNVLSNLDKDNPAPSSTGKPSANGDTAYFQLQIGLQQNGDRADKLSGVLVSDQPLIGKANSVYIAEFPVSEATWEKFIPAATSTPTATSTSPVARPATATSEQPLLIAVLGAAFIGGLILNLMPCVLPVLSLKVFSLMKHAGENPKAAWIQGAAFTAGVVLSFWVLAGLLLALRSAGNHLGWGFQMQSPGFVLALIGLFFLLALNLFGVFELGTSLVGLDAKTTGRWNGTLSSFGNGALATIAATPCTAPFMGSALGFAAQQPAYVSMLIFTFLAFGMASPYLLLTIFPGALKFVPKPGAWMESFKQFMGFLLMATVAWLVPVYGKLAGTGWLAWLLFALLFTGMAAWIYGRWSVLRALAFLVVAGLGLYALRPMPDTGWQPWTPDAVQKALADGKPVFVDFTADWCLSCKVNERVALDTDAVKKAFADKGVVLLRGDWTNADADISKTLQQYNRDGVPLYLLYSPKAKDAPQVLPEVLTPGIVLDALNKI